MTFVKVLTNRMGRPRIRIVKMTPVIRMLEDALAGRRVSDVAEEWGIPRHVLDNWRIGKTRLPGSRYLSPVARGLGITVDELLATANGARKAKAKAS